MNMTIHKLKRLFALVTLLPLAAMTSVLNADVELGGQPAAKPAMAPQKFDSDLYRVEKKVISVGQIGEQAKYSIRINAVGAHDLGSVRVIEALPAGLDFVSATPAPNGDGLSWNWTNMKAGTSQEIVVTVVPRTPDTWLVTNTQVCACPVLLAAPIMVGAPKLDITKVGPGSVLELGELANFTVTVSNKGTAPATDVVVTDTLPAGLADTKSNNSVLSYAIGTLNPGESRTIEVPTKTKLSGTWENTAQVTSKQVGPRYAKAPVTVVESKLSISKSGDPLRFVWTNANYTIVARNIGNTTLTNVVITDKIPAGTKYVSSSDNGTVSGETVQWTVAKLVPGESVTRNITLTGTAVGKTTNVATVSAGRLVETASAVTEWEGPPGVLTEIVDDVDPIKVGDMVTYTIRITNQSPYRALTSDAVVELTSGMTTVEAKDAKATLAGQRIIVKDISLQPKESYTFTVKAKATKAGIQGARLEFGTGFLPRPTVKEESTYVY